MCMVYYQYCYVLTVTGKISLNYYYIIVYPTKNFDEFIFQL